MLMRLPADALRRGVITYSSGNHGQAVALAASKLGAPAVIVMPTTAPAIKVAGVKRWGGEVILEGTVPDRWMKRMAEDIVEECSGVKQVHNRLRVEKSNGPEISGSSYSTGSSATGSTGAAGLTGSTGSSSSKESSFGTTGTTSGSEKTSRSRSTT